MPLVDVIILTHQEELNLPHALRSLDGLDCAIFVVDSGSTDQTVQIARACGAQVVTHEFESQARQLNWALDTLPLTAMWTLRLDADEHLTDDLVQEIGLVVANAPADVAGYLIKRRVYFWGAGFALAAIIRHGCYGCGERARPGPKTPGWTSIWS